MTDKENRNLRWLSIGVAALCTIGISVGGWQTITTIGHSNALAAMQSNRFTSSDGLEVWKAIAEIKEDLARIPKEVPPKWFIDQVQGIANTIERVEAKVDANTERLIRLEK